MLKNLLKGLEVLLHVVLVDHFIIGLSILLVPT